MALEEADARALSRVTLVSQDHLRWKHLMKENPKAVIDAVNHPGNGNVQRRAAISGYTLNKPLRSVPLATIWATEPFCVVHPDVFEQRHQALLADAPSPDQPGYHRHQLKLLRLYQAVTVMRRYLGAYAYLPHLDGDRVNWMSTDQVKTQSLSILNNLALLPPRPTPKPTDEKRLNPHARPLMYGPGVLNPLAWQRCMRLILDEALRFPIPFMQNLVMTTLPAMIGQQVEPGEFVTVSAIKTGFQHFQRKYGSVFKRYRQLYDHLVRTLFAALAKFPRVKSEDCGPVDPIATADGPLFAMGTSPRTIVFPGQPQQAREAFEASLVSIPFDDTLTNQCRALDAIVTGILVQPALQDSHHEQTIFDASRDTIHQMLTFRARRTPYISESDFFPSLPALQSTNLIYDLYHLLDVPGLARRLPGTEDLDWTLLTDDQDDATFTRQPGCLSQSHSKTAQNVSHLVVNPFQGHARWQEVLTNQRVTISTQTPQTLPQPVLDQGDNDASESFDVPVMMNGYLNNTAWKYVFMLLIRVLLDGCPHLSLTRRWWALGTVFQHLGVQVKTTHMPQFDVLLELLISSNGPLQQCRDLQPHVTVLQGVLTYFVQTMVRQTQGVHTALIDWLSENTSEPDLRPTTLTLDGLGPWSDNSQLHALLCRDNTLPSDLTDDLLALSADELNPHAKRLEPGTDQIKSAFASRMDFTTAAITLKTQLQRVVDGHAVSISENKTWVHTLLHTTNAEEGLELLNANCPNPMSTLPVTLQFMIGYRYLTVLSQRQKAQPLTDVERCLLEAPFYTRACTVHALAKKVRALLVTPDLPASLFDHSHTALRRTIPASLLRQLDRVPLPSILMNNTST